MYSSRLRSGPDSQMSMIDLDKPTTWPSAVMDWAGSYAESLRGSTHLTPDLDVPLEGEDEFRSLLDGHGVLAFHCTRLLDHEVKAIRTQGLRMLTRELVEERIAEAHCRGCITDGQQNVALERNVFARHDEHGREGQVCLVLGRQAFNEPGNGCEPLLSGWGGEGLNGGPFGNPWDLAVGTPTLVVACVDLSVSHRVSPTFPDLHKLFVGTLLGTEQTWADVHLRAPVLSGDILEIWQPGHPEYDRHADLPR
jgi:hypothetical protein